ncbi:MULTISPECIES: OmpH family outer membrane protein [unclassified Mitsuokella]|uniref:OmpH family outer membrane protein n=1 Tax=unclassified Mitsuokella TaxID=2637239 RepID=UPI000E468D5F|nr:MULTISPECIES: OmpH family outer membrane protein [unclassified Mitsuokella]RGS73681.1 OmpH family outer membrane protein [Mitsuokella sp. AF21-1AC]RHM55292.1 OmpH family outer membrane protein [Mitsuokella sp. AF33-22]
MKLRKKSLGLLAAAFAATLLMSGCGQAKIGYIDGSRVMQEAPQVKSLVDEGNQKINEAREEAEKSLQDNPDMSQEDAQKAQQEAQRKMMSLNQSYQMQLQQKINGALQDIAKQKKLDAVIDSEKSQPTAIYGCTDVTDDVIAKLQ